MKSSDDTMRNSLTTIAALAAIANAAATSFDYAFASTELSTSRSLHGTVSAASSSSRSRRAAGLPLQVSKQCMSSRSSS